MKATMTMMMVAVFMAMMACGTPQGYQTAEEQAKAEQKQNTASNPTAALSNPGDYMEVAGYVSPINISVDGKSYKDSEDFYSQEFNRLQAQVKAQYPGYKLTFDAQVGLRNFKNGMYVFLVATSDIGVASETYVDASGKFTFMIDGKADRNSDYTLRATKRIGLQLSKKGQETISWCYNMYAEKNVMLDGKPNVLRNFATSVTEYQCDSTEGITLPEADQTEMDAAWDKASEAEAKRDTANNMPVEDTSVPADTSTDTSK